MSNSINSLFTIMENDLRHKNLKAKVTSDNIQNANTPGYQASEVITSKPSNNSFASVMMEVTNKHHLTGKRNDNAKVRKQKDVYETKPNGNNVSLDQQMLILSQNYTDYKITLQVYEASYGLLNSSLNVS